MRLSGTSPMMAVVCVSDRASLTGSPEDDSQAQSPVLHCHIFLSYLDVCVVFTALLSHYGSEGSRAETAVLCGRSPITGCHNFDTLCEKSWCLGPKMMHMFSV